MVVANSTYDLNCTPWVKSRGGGECMYDQPQAVRVVAGKGWGANAHRILR